MEKTPPQLDLNGLGGRVRKYVQWPDVRNVGVIQFDEDYVHVIDTRARAVVVVYRKGQMREPRFLLKSFDDIMARFGRLYEGRSLMSGAPR